MLSGSWPARQEYLHGRARSGQALAPLEGLFRQALRDVGLLGRAVDPLRRVGDDVVELRVGAVGVDQEGAAAVADGDVGAAVGGDAGEFEERIVAAVFPEEGCLADDAVLADPGGADLLAVEPGL